MFPEILIGNVPAPSTDDYRRFRDKLGKVGIVYSVRDMPHTHHCFVVVSFLDSRSGSQLARVFNEVFAPPLFAQGYTSAPDALATIELSDSEDEIVISGELDCFEKNVFQPGLFLVDPFPIPIGGLVKVCRNGERFWCIVREKLGYNGRMIVEVNNDLVFNKDLPLGHIVCIEANHIWEWAPPM